MLTSDFDYELPSERIAKFPPKERGTTRLLVIDRKTSKISHHKYSDLHKYFSSGDVAVLNETKVIKARFYLKSGHRSKLIECLLLKPLGTNDSERTNWEALLGSAKKLQPGDRIYTEDNKQYFELLERKDKLVVLSVPNIPDLFTKYGHTPLPPYMKREDKPEDYRRYNTIFATNEGSVAAPTASLNLTDSLLTTIKSKGAEIAYVDLTVGWGTFAPVNTESIEEFKIHTEKFELSEASAQLINNAKNSDKKVFAFGTTATRTLESSAFMQNGNYNVNSQKSETNIFIYPGYEWKIVDHLITNFHAPKSSLIMLVASMLGVELTKFVYNEAIKEKYNFLSYGDSMLIL